MSSTPLSHTAISHAGLSTEPVIADRAVQRPSALKRALRSNKAASLVLLVVLLAAWEGGTRFFSVPKFLIPPFSEVMVALWRGLATGVMAKDGLWFHFGHQK